MNTLTFPHSAELDQIIGHAIDKGLAVLLVHDQGIYLMVETLKVPDGSKAICAYAEGCDPTRDSDWYDTARDLVGGDDFVEQLVARDLGYLIAGQNGIRVSISESHLSITSTARVS